MGLPRHGLHLVYTKWCTDNFIDLKNKIINLASELYFASSLAYLKGHFLRCNPINTSNFIPLMLFLLLIYLNSVVSKNKNVFPT